MSIERINPDDVYEPNNDAYSQVVKATGNTHVHVAGSIGLTDDGELVSDDMREQTERIVEVLSNSLAAAGADVSDVVRVRLLTVDAADYLSRCHDVVIEWYGDHKPASTLHEVSGLAAPEFKVEIEATAVLEE